MSQATGDEQLIANFIRLQPEPDGFALAVAVVTWATPHEPSLRWTPVHRWKKRPSPRNLAAAQDKALRDPAYFRLCDKCGTRNNAGHMHSRDICQACAERHLGVVY